MSILSEKELAEIEDALEEEKSINLTASLDRILDPYKLKKDISFSEHDLDGAMTEQASLYSYYSSLSAKAQLQTDRSKHSMEIIEAKLYHFYREEYRGEKVTESFIQKMVMVDKKYVAAVKRYNDAKMIGSLCKEATESFRHRRDMLTQISKWRLEENKGEMFLKGVNSSMEEKKKAVLDRINK